MSTDIINFMKQLFLRIAENSVFKTIISTVVSLFAYFIGAEHQGGVAALAILCLIDTVFALYVLHKKKKALQSRKLPKKLFDLIIYIILIATMNVLGKTSALFGGFLIEAMIVWFSATEALSILEHAGELGYKIPISVLQNIKKVRDEK